MSNWLYRLGRFAARRRVWVVAAWVLIALGALVIDRAAGGGTVDNFEVPGVESQQAVDLLKEKFPERSGATAMVLFHTPGRSSHRPWLAGRDRRTVAEVRALDHVVAVTEPLAGPRSMSADGATASRRCSSMAPPLIGS